MTTTTLRRATLASGDVVDVVVDGSTIIAITTAPAAPVGADPPGTLVDLEGYVLLPAPIEPHAHLDKMFLAEVVPNPSGDLLGAIDAIDAHRDLIDFAGTIARAERGARLMAANGYVAIRTHADLTPLNGLASVEALVEVRRRLGDLIDIEIVALCGTPATTADQLALLRDALAAGADLVGGCPYRDDALDAVTDTLLQVASDHGVGVDFHTDETLDPAANGLAVLARHVSGGFSGRTTASHCVSLGQQPEHVQRSTAEAVAQAGIGVVTLPATNLYLQGRSTHLVPRALTALAALRAAGALVAAGADNIHDPFQPLGRADAFETATLAVLAGHMLIDQAWTAVSTDAAAVLGRRSGLVVGGPADLLAVPGATLREAIGFAPAHRIRWKSGVAATSG